MDLEQAAVDLYRCLLVSTNGSVPPYNLSNQGWLFGMQMEIWF